VHQQETCRVVVVEYIKFQIMPDRRTDADIASLSPVSILSAAAATAAAAARDMSVWR